MASSSSTEFYPSKEGSIWADAAWGKRSQLRVLKSMDSAIPSY